jgi:hypothetical protein
VDATVFASLDIAVPSFEIPVRVAVEAGLDAAAIFDGKGKLLAVAGALDKDEARAIAAHATRQFRSRNLLERLLGGETLTTSLGNREAHIGIAAKCVFFVVVIPRDPAAMSLVAIDELRSDIEELVGDTKSRVSKSSLPPPSGSGGSSSGPAELPAVELGVTARRRNPN